MKEAPFEKVVRKTESVLCVIGAGFLFLLMLVGASDVIGRYVFNRPISGATEYGQMLMAAMVFLFWAYTQSTKGHVTVEVLVSHYPPLARAITGLVISVLSLAVFVIIMWQAVILSVEDWQIHRVFALTGVSLGYLRVLISLGAFIICLEFIVQLRRLLLELKKGKGN